MALLDKTVIILPPIQGWGKAQRRRSRLVRRAAILGLIALLLAACVNLSTPETTAPTVSTETASHLPTFTTTFTPSPHPTGTPLPTGTPENTPEASPSPTFSPSFTATPVPEVSIRFAVIGDYGSAGPGLEAVANLINGWGVDFIITTGDNNYPSGSGNTIDKNVGQYFHAYISPYNGSYGEGVDTNRFFPTLGNHDWMTAHAQPYLDYFTLPGNERYYTFTWGAVAFFALDSDENEPDGVGRSSVQATWLQGQLAASQAPWKIVYMHHPAYSSGMHGSTDWMRWPFQEWGATAVLAGHDHTYERLQVGDIPYFVVGNGGYTLYNFTDILEESQFRYNAGFGALLVQADASNITFQFTTSQGEVLDTYSLSK